MSSLYDYNNLKTEIISWLKDLEMETKKKDPAWAKQVKLARLELDKCYFHIENLDEAKELAEMRGFVDALLMTCTKNVQNLSENAQKNLRQKTLKIYDLLKSYDKKLSYGR